MRDQISLLIEKLEFFVESVKKEQGKTKRGEYFTMKDEEFRGKFSLKTEKSFHHHMSKLS